MDRKKSHGGRAVVYQASIKQTPDAGLRSPNRVVGTWLVVWPARAEIGEGVIALGVEAFERLRELIVDQLALLKFLPENLPRSGNIRL